MRKILTALTAIGLLGGCVDSGAPVASVERTREAAYRSPDRPEITLMTVVNNSSGAGAHTSLLISGSQRVIFDPAGSFRHDTVPERGDVLFGVSPAVERGYRSAHSRASHHVVTQRFAVSPEQAEQALQLALSNGYVASAYCTRATSALLRQVDGFQDIDVTFYPVRLMEQLEQKPGVETNRLFENDAGDIVDGYENLQL